VVSPPPVRHVATAAHKLCSTQATARIVKRMPLCRRLWRPCDAPAQVRHCPNYDYAAHHGKTLLQKMMSPRSPLLPIIQSPNRILLSNQILGNRTCCPCIGPDLRSTNRHRYLRYLLHLPCWISTILGSHPSSPTVLIYLLRKEHPGFFNAHSLLHSWTRLSKTVRQGILVPADITAAYRAFLVAKAELPVLLWI
jgi:hypothetical protein